MLASLAFAGVFLGLALQRRDARHLLHWAASSGSYAVTLIGFQCVDHRAPAWIAPLLTAMLAASNLLLVSGTRAFHGLPAFRAWMMALPLAAGIGSSSLPLSAAVRFPLSVAAAQVCESLGVAIGCAAAGLALLRAGPRPVSRGQRIAAAAVLAYLPAYCGNIVGALALDGLSRETFATLPLLGDQLLLGVMYLALLGMAAERAQQRLRDAAMRDPLTGAFNRTGLRTWADRHFRAGAAVIAFDIDQFKTINDTHGHAAGDAVLVALVEAACGALGDGAGRIVRSGGDEFVVLLPEGGQAQAEAVLRRMRRSVPAHASAVAWTFSAGVAAADGADRTLDDVLRRADERLYAAKRACGRRLAA